MEFGSTYQLLEQISKYEVLSSITVRHDLNELVPKGSHIWRLETYRSQHIWSIRESKRPGTKHNQSPTRIEPRYGSTRSSPTIPFRVKRTNKPFRVYETNHNSRTKTAPISDKKNIPKSLKNNETDQQLVTKVQTKQPFEQHKHNPSESM